MIVAELIKILQTYDQNLPVSVWDPFYDQETSNVFVSHMGTAGRSVLGRPCVIICNTDFHS